MIFVLNSFVAFAEFDDKVKPATKALTGRVVAESGEILPGVSLTIVETGETFFADMDGNFQLPVPTGKVYTITINTIGFFPLSVNTNEMLPFSEQVLQPLP
jgi:hypothetical protein